MENRTYLQQPSNNRVKIKRVSVFSGIFAGLAATTHRDKRKQKRK